MATELIKISMPKELVDKIDVAAREEFANRSEFIRWAIVQYLQTLAERRNRLAAAAQNTDIPTEKMIYELLRQREARRNMAVYMREVDTMIRQRHARRKGLPN